MRQWLNSLSSLEWLRMGRRRIDLTTILRQNFWPPYPYFADSNFSYLALEFFLKSVNPQKFIPFFLANNFITICFQHLKTTFELFSRGFTKLIESDFTIIVTVNFRHFAHYHIVAMVIVTGNRFAHQPRNQINILFIIRSSLLCIIISLTRLWIIFILVFHTTTIMSPGELSTNIIQKIDIIFGP